MNKTSPVTENYSRWMRLALIVGIAAAVVAVIGLFVSDSTTFYQAYLFSFVFWLGISIGSLAILLLHFVVGTRWGLTIRRVAEAAAGVLPLMAVLFIPLLLGMNILYPWTDPAVVEASHFLPYKTWYLNVPGFIIRAVIYFASWIIVTLLVNRASARLSAAPGDAAVFGRLQRLGAVGLIVLVLTVTFAATDWLMSLEPEWTSTAYGLEILVAMALSALAFALLALNLLPNLSLGRRWTAATTPMPYSDLGALLMVFVLGYAYLAYFQFLIIWAGNIPREVVWYLARSEGGWSAVLIFVAVFQFILPFIILLSGRARHSLRFLAILSGLLLFTSLVNMFWHVKPAFFPGQLALSWLDLVLPIAMGGLWLAGFFYMLQRRPALNPTEEVALELREQRI